MKLVERILVATDFSPASDAALKTGIFVAKKFRCEVLLLHVVPVDVEASAAERSEIEKKVKERLELAADTFRAEGIESIEMILSTGIEFEQLLDMLIGFAMQRG